MERTEEQGSCKCVEGKPLKPVEVSSEYWSCPCEALNYNAKRLQNLLKLTNDMIEEGNKGISFDVKKMSILTGPVMRDIEGLPCTCQSETDLPGKIYPYLTRHIEKRKLPENTTCKCPDYERNENLLKIMKIEIIKKMKIINELHAEMKKKESRCKTYRRKDKTGKKVLTENNVVSTDTLPYDVLMKKMEQKHQSRVEGKYNLIQKIVKDKPDKSLEAYNEDTFRDEVGWHRLIPNKMGINFILERAFRNKGDQATLFEVMKQTIDASKYREKDVFDEKLSFYSWENKIIKEEVTEIKETTVCPCIITSRKITILENMIDILSEFPSSLELPKRSKLPSSARHRRTEEEVIKTAEVPLYRQSVRVQKYKKNIEVPKRDDEWKEVNKQQKRKIIQEAIYDFFEMQMSQPFQSLENPEDYIIEKLMTIMVKFTKPPFIDEEEEKECAIQEIDKMSPESLPSRKNPLFVQLDKAKKLVNLIEKEADENARNTRKTLKSFHKESYNAFDEGDFVSEESDSQIDDDVESRVSFQLQLWQEVQKIWQEAEEAVDSANTNLKRMEIQKLLKLLKISKISPALEEKLSKPEDQMVEHCKCSSLLEKEEYFEGLIEKLQRIFLENSKVQIGQNDSSSDVGRKESLLSLIEDSEMMEHVYEGKKTMSFIPEFENIWTLSILNGLLSINMDIQVMERERIFIYHEKRNKHNKRVKIISGGRIGLEPLYPEYVAKGMLDCVILGNKYSGPTVKQIVQGILEIASEEGVLIIIMNEFEYRLNFMLAIEEVKKKGIEADLVLARDEAYDAQPVIKHTGRPGSVGIVLQFKVAAAMANEGHPLNMISRVCQFMFIASVTSFVKPVGICIGMGCNPEIGRSTESNNLLDVTNEMLKMLIHPEAPYTLAPEPDTDIILLVNNCNLIYDAIYRIVTEVAEKLIPLNVKLRRIYAGSFVSLPCEGFSLCIAKDWNGKLTRFLDMPTSCYHWSCHTSNNDFLQGLIKTQDTTGPGAKIHLLYLPLVKYIFEECLKLMRKFSDEIKKKWSGLANQITDAVNSLRPKYYFNKIAVDRPMCLLLCLAKHLEDIDNFGKQLSIMLTVAAQEFNTDDSQFVTWRMCCNAFYCGAISLAGYLRHEKGDGSICDFLIPLAKAIQSMEMKEEFNPLITLNNKLGYLEKCGITKTNNPGIRFCYLIFKNNLEIFINYLDESSWEESDLQNNQEIIEENEEISSTIITDHKEIDENDEEMSLKTNEGEEEEEEEDPVEEGA